MQERRYQADIERLRAPERLARLEVERVVQACLEGITTRSVLDVGTGSGVFAEAFAAHGLEVSGVDVNPAMIEAAQRFVPAGHFHVAPAEVIPLPDHTFDLVFMGLVFHEVDDAAQALAEAKRVGRSRLAILEWPYRAEEPGPPLAHRLPPETIIAQAETAGFQQIETFPLNQLVLYRLSW
ncbi:MAG: class I SAM-dependent methyltransferase [Anaerolineales bacterium]